MSFKLVYVRFYDHFSEDSVEDPDRLRPTVVEAVGWLIREDDRYLYLSPWISRDEKVAYDINGILKSTIIEVRELEAPNR